MFDATNFTHTEMLVSPSAVTTKAKVVRKAPRNRTSKIATQYEAERKKAEAVAMYEASVKFGGPLIAERDLPFHTFRAGYYSSHWAPVPKEDFAAKKHGREMAFALLSVSPNACYPRQSVMARVGLDVLADQIKRMGGQVDRWTPEWQAIAELWETIIRFAESEVTFGWLNSWRENCADRDEREKATEERCAAEAAADRSERAKKAAAKRWANYRQSKERANQAQQPDAVVHLVRQGAA